MFSKPIVVILMGILTGTLMLVLGADRIGFAQEEPWSEPFLVSDTPGQSWFPDLAADSAGYVHLVWSETNNISESEQKEQVFYRRWDGKSWSESNDIVPPSPDIIRTAIFADRTATLNMLAGGSVHGGLTLYYQKASFNEAWSAAAWSTAHRISLGSSYMGDIAVDSRGTIHVVYDDTIAPLADRTPTFADVYYRYSVDGGRTWSRPVNLSLSGSTGSSRAQMEIDGRDTIYVTWDEGWDRLAGGGDPIYSGYVSSSDGGMAWSPAITITYPITTVSQLTVGSDSRGGVMLAWRTSRDEIFYQWSTDDGRTWEKPSVVPGVFARHPAGTFDMYDMAADSAGHIHLLVVGGKSAEEGAQLGVYHTEWDGTAWSSPKRIDSSRGFPEYPKLAISNGNQLHAAWFERADVWTMDDNDPYQVWYSTGRSSAPSVPATPVPTLTPTPPAATPTSAPTATPYPTVSSVDIVATDDLFTENDEVLRLVIALSPAILIIAMITAFRRGWFRRLR